MEITLKNWESRFFSKNIYSLKFSNGDLESLPKLNEALLKFNSQIKEYPNESIFEINLSLSNFSFISTIENYGFRIVDSKFQFITLIDESNNLFFDFKYDNRDFLIREFSTKELDEILKLTQNNIIDNNKLFSRYKANYFEYGEMKSYFLNWVEECTLSDKAFIAVAEERKSNKIVGYFIYRESSKFNGKPLFKGILTSVDPAWRGHNIHNYMQHYLFNRIPHRVFYIDNTTQLSNMGVIKNHFKFHKKPYKISVIFFKRK